MSDRSFTQLVDMLTSEHPEWVQTDQGSTLVMQNGLLERIREAVFGGASGGGGAQGKAKLPLDATALDILEQIDKEAAEALVILTKKPVPYGHTEAYVRLWSAGVDENDILTITVRETLAEDIDPDIQPRVFDAKRETTAYALVSGWVEKIESYFDPAKNVPVPASCPLPECEQRFVYRRSDGQTVRMDALSIQIARENGKIFGASCAACGHHWAVAEIPRLATLCGFTPEAEAVEYFMRGAPTLE